MFDLEKAIQRNKLITAMQSMSKDELTALGDCDHDCPVWYKKGCGCSQCHDNKGNCTEDELAELPDEIIELLKRPEGLLGPDGCEAGEWRSLDCRRFLCNPFQKVAGVNNG